MDQGLLSSDSVLQMLLKTNRPPTDQEKAIIQESVAPTKAKLKIVEEQMSDTIAYIQALKAQVEQGETKLQRLREEEAAILKTFADHHRVSSPFRNLPEDVLREICISYVEDDMPTLSYRVNRSKPLPYVLAQISSGMRHIALTTPHIWASMKVDIGGFDFHSPGEYDQAYSILAREAIKWFERAGGLSLTVFIEDCRYTGLKCSESDQSNILFDTLLSYSTRWKELQYSLRSCHGVTIYTPVIHIAALTASDVPLLQSVSLSLDCLSSNPVFRDSEFLTTPTLKCVKLETCNIQMFTVDWSILTSVTLRGFSLYSWKCHSNNLDQIGRILQQTKRLVFCDIAVDSDRSEVHYPHKINLPFLKTLIVSERHSGTTSSRDPSILDLIIAPILETLHIGGVGILVSHKCGVFM